MLRAPGLQKPLRVPPEHSLFRHREMRLSEAGPAKVQALYLSKGITVIPAHSLLRRCAQRVSANQDLLRAVPALFFPTQSTLFSYSIYSFFLFNLLAL